MKLLFLGTGAADYSIKPECEMTQNDRRYTTTLVDGKFLLDVSPQSYGFAERLKTDLSELEFVLLSHTHSDHYNKQSLLSFAALCGHKITVFCQENAVARLCLEEKDLQYINPVGLKIGEEIEAFGYKIRPLEANHLVENSPEVPVHYVVSDGQKTLFYGSDGGCFTARTWEYMRKNCFFHVMILEATVGEKDGDFRLGTHNSIPMLRIIKASLDESKLIDENSVLFATHMARTLHKSRKDTEEKLRALGIIAAYDGFEAEI